ncbi:terminase, putative [Babesia caballi]|uniref:Terminase, putative n=1 Tax=Babesia caballi TaxID=5871 RepID=A0AAV4LPK0_BABCB|nr:terminase, putative [Babesia caballi]
MSKCDKCTKGLCLSPHAWKSGGMPSARSPAAFRRQYSPVNSQLAFRVSGSVELVPVDLVHEGVPRVLLGLVEGLVVVQPAVGQQQPLLAAVEASAHALHVNYIAPLPREVVLRGAEAVEDEGAHLVDLLVEPALAQVLHDGELAPGDVANDGGAHRLDPHLADDDVVDHDVAALQRVVLVGVAPQQLDHEGADDADLDSLAGQPDQSLGAPIRLEVLAGAVEGADGRVVADLLANEVEPAVGELVGLAEQGVERLVGATHSGTVGGDTEQSDVGHAIDGVLQLGRGVEELAVLEDLAVALQRGGGLVQADGHADAGEVLADEVLQNGPEAHLELGARPREAGASTNGDLGHRAGPARVGHADVAQGARQTGYRAGGIFAARRLVGGLGRDAALGFRPVAIGPLDDVLALEELVLHEAAIGAVGAVAAVGKHRVALLAHEHLRVCQAALAVRVVGGLLLFQLLELHVAPRHAEEGLLQVLAGTHLLQVELLRAYEVLVGDHAQRLHLLQGVAGELLAELRKDLLGDLIEGAGVAEHAVQRGLRLLAKPGLHEELRDVHRLPGTIRRGVLGLDRDLARLLPGMSRGAV